MASIKSSLELIDKVSKPLDSINSRLNLTIKDFGNAGNAADRMSTKAGSAMTRTSSIASRLGQTLGSIPSQLQSVSYAMQSLHTRSNSLFRTLTGVAIAQKAFGMITSQVSSSLERMDTLNNFPKVMSNLGISTDESSASVNTLSERLKGLPTTLQDGAAAVQRFTSSNGNVQASTEMFLALNNAILAGGADMNTQRSALEQLSQSYAKGKPDMMEWRSAMTAMPAQMKQVAKAMGYMSADDLGAALRSGKASMDDFMNTMVKMNKTSVAGFRSLEEQARNATGGFSTTIANLKSAVTRGVAGMIEETNRALESSGLPTIQKMITSIGSTLESVLKGIGKVFGKIVAWIAENKEEILGWIKTIVSVGIAWSVVSSVITTIIGLVQFLSTVVSIFGGVFSAVFGVAAIAGIVALSNQISGVIDWIGDLNEKTGDVGKTIEVVFAYVKVVIEKVKSWFMVAINTITIAWNTMCLGMSTMINGVASVVLNMVGIIQSAFDWIHNELSIWDDFADKLSPEMQQKLGINGDTFRWKGGSQTLADADALAKQIENDAASTAKKNDELMKQIKNSDSGVTKAKANAKALEDRYTRNLGNDRGKSGKDKTTKTKTTTSAIATNTDKTAKNTAKISKQLALNGETLKYIKDFATQKAINRYTSSTIKVNMTNHNNIASNMNIDGVVKKLKSKLETELASTAEGVHA